MTRPIPIPDIATEPPGPTTNGHKAPVGWPVLAPDAYYGLPGDIVNLLAPHTEADPAGLLLTFIVGYGNSVGGGPHAAVGAAKHPPRIFGVLVGDTSRARKGTSWSETRRILHAGDPCWADQRTMGGLGSGEGLIETVRDKEESTDRRLFVVEPEFARVLAVASRQGSTLSAVIRQCFDTGDLRVMTRNDPLTATGAHISILGHVTLEEIRSKLADVEMASGFANRFCFALVRRAKLLPFGGQLADHDITLAGKRIAARLDQARRRQCLGRTPAAAEFWVEIYTLMAAGPPGLTGMITARAEAQALRLSVAYALTDGADRIELDHVKAGWALWSYCQASADYIFGEQIGDFVADKLLAAIKAAGPEGLDGRAQHEVFNRNLTGQKLEESRSLLEARGLVVTESVKEKSGRPRIVTRMAGLQLSPYLPPKVPP